MPVLFRGTSLRPAPQVSLSKSWATAGDGRVIGTVVTIRLTGTLTAEKTNDTDTPLSIDHRLSAILAKQQSLRDTFSKSGLLEIQGFDTAAPTKTFAIVDSVDFSEGPWTDKADYTVSLHSPGILGEDNAELHCESVSDSWTFEEGEFPRSWKATHSVAAKGNLVYDIAGNVPLLPWQIARKFVEEQLGVGWTATGSGTFSPQSGQSLAALSAVVPGSTNAWNRVVSETIDETEGTYSISESWTLSPDPWVEEYVVSTRRVDEPKITTTASISGTIHGLRANMSDQQEKYANAALRWGTVKDLLASRCQARVAGTTLGLHPVGYNVDHDEFNGTIQYQADFDDRLYINDTFETYTISQSAGDEDYRTSVRIDGTIAGALYLDDGPSKTIKYTRASLQWEIIKPVLLARVIQETGFAGLKPFPVTAQVTPDRAAGTISYSYEFSDQTPATVRNEYTVTKRFSREDGTDVISIEGTINGLRSAHADSPFGTGDANEKYTNALAYWNGISGNLLGLAAQYIDLQNINPAALSTSVGHNPLAGTVSYSVEYTSRVNPTTSGALSEVITIQDEDAVPLIAIIPVLGRSAGPVIQDLGSVKEKRRTLSMEIVMTPAKYGTGPPQQPSVSIGAYVPVGTSVFKEQDNASWSPNTGRYSRTVSWIYE